MSILVGDTLYFDAMMEAAARNCGLMIPQTPQLGGWLISTADLAAVTPDITWRYSSVIRSTSVRMMEAAAQNCGLMIPQTPQLGGWLISTAEVATVTPDITWTILVGDTLYFSANDGSSGHELWAHDTSNASTWQVADIYSGTGTSNPGYYGMEILVGDTLYFSADDGSSGWELWAHDTSNASTWQVADIDSGTGNSNPGQYMEILVGDTLYFDASDGSSGYELWALQPGEITSLSSGSGSGSGSGGSGSGMTNLTNATSCVASPSLPNGLNIDSSTCTISGTPTVTTSNATYTVTAVINSTTFQTTVWLSSSPFATITSRWKVRISILVKLWARSRSTTLHKRVTEPCTTATEQHGRWLISTAELPAVPRIYMEIFVGDTLYFSAMMEAAAQNCGLMIPQTPQLGGWLISTAELAAVTPDNYMAILVGDTLYFSAMMEAAARTVGS